MGSKKLKSYSSTIPITRAMVEDDAYRKYMPKNIDAWFTYLSQYLMLSTIQRSRIQKKSWAKRKRHEAKITAEGEKANQENLKKIHEFKNASPMGEIYSSTLGKLQGEYKPSRHIPDWVVYTETKEVWASGRTNERKDSHPIPQGIVRELSQA